MRRSEQRTNKGARRRLVPSPAKRSFATSSRKLLRIAALVLATALPTRADVKPGDVIDRSNWQAAEGLAPESVLRWVERGDLSFVVGEMKDEVAFEPAFHTASKANAGRYDVDDEGTLIEHESGKRPAHTYGFPFPNVGEGDANAGIKVMWNSSFGFFKSGSLTNRFNLVWMGRRGFERNVGGRVAFFWFDGRKRAVDNPDRAEVRDLFFAETPASANGVANLTWRYLDARPDTVWNYSPAARRVRQLTSSNRSDPFFGADVTQDDALLWAGKHQSFTWKLVGSTEMLVPAADLSYVPLVEGRTGPMGREWLSQSSFEGARFGWQTPGWTGAPWMPTNFTWVKRPLWIVEGHPKDPYYSYGRQIFYLDRSTYKIYYKVVYTPAGEYWKTLLNDVALAEAPDGSRHLIGASLVAVDDRSDHATYTKGAAPDHIFEYNSARLEPDLFTIGGLLRRAK